MAATGYLPAGLRGPSINLDAKLQQQFKLRRPGGRLTSHECKASSRHHEPLSSTGSGSERPACLHASRRVSNLAAAAAVVFHQLLPGKSLADEPANNGFWYTEFPLPDQPAVTSKIANEETGTRSFLKKGIYIANVGAKSSALRLKHYAFDLLTLADLFGQDAWPYIRRYLCFKSTIMYYDFDTVIAAAADDDKPPLTGLANRLFDSVEQLESAVRKKDDEATRARYADAEVILKEVMAKMA